MAVGARASRAAPVAHVDAHRRGGRDERGAARARAASRRRGAGAARPRVVVVDVAIVGEPGVARRLAGLRRLDPEIDTVAPVGAEELLAGSRRARRHAIGEHMLLRELPAPALDAFIASTGPGSGSRSSPPSCAISAARSSPRRVGVAADPEQAERVRIGLEQLVRRLAPWTAEAQQADSHPRDLRRCSSMRLYDYAASGNCYKVRLLLSLLGREYERVPVDIFAGDTLTDAYGALNPVRETPVLELDSGAVVAQSSAILWYLAEDSPFLPARQLDRALVLQWLAFEQERVMGGIGGPRFRRITGRPPLAGGWRSARRRSSCSTSTSTGATGWSASRRRSPTSRVFGYAHVAHEAGLEPGERVRAWFDRVCALPGFVADLSRRANARPGAGRSIYD